RHTRSDRDWSSDVCSSDLGSPCGEVEDHRRRDEGFAGDRTRQPGAVPGEGEEHRDNGDAQERAARLGDHGGGAGEEARGEGSPRSEERRVGKEGRTGWETE